MFKKLDPDPVLPVLKTLHHGQGPKKKGTNRHLPLQVQPGLKPCPPQKQDGLQVPQCSRFSCISKSHSHLITLVIRNRDTTPEGLTALDQQPLTRGVHIRMGNRPGKKPEHAAFTSAGSLSAAEETLQGLIWILPGYSRKPAMCQTLRPATVQ